MRAGAAARVGMVLLGLALGLAAATLAWVLLRRGDAATYTDPKSGAAVRYFRRDADLGYAALPGRAVRARRTSGGRTIYDAVYTIDDEGLRATPGSRPGPGFVFFGCSYTFGEGIGDADTLPSHFARALAFPAEVRNYGFHGWGPHQMVRLLETDRVRGGAGPVRRAFYQSHPQHASRSAGRSPWDPGGPRYVADAGEALVRHTGPFHGAVVAFALRAANRIGPLRKLRERLLFARAPDDAERELHARLVLRAAALARERLAAPLTVLHWDDGSAADERFLARLTGAGIDVVRVSGVVPRDRWNELMIPGDGHPLGAANELLARHLAARYGDPSTVATSAQMPSATR